MTSGPHHTGESQGFPLGTAPDLLVKNELGHASIVNYAKIRETAVFCALCDFPMVVRVVQKPCCHIICYTCYCQSPKACKICDERIETIIRLPDKLKISLVKDEDGFPVYRDE